MSFEEDKIGFYPDPAEAPAGLVKRAIADRQALERHETEDYLRKESLNYEQRSTKYWNRNYSSVQAFLDSIEPNRRHWAEALGEFDLPTGKLLPKEQFMKTDLFTANWICLRFTDHICARAILALPNKVSEKVPLIICQHGIGSSPEMVFGFEDPEGSYRAYGRRLAEKGYAVLAPLHITESAPRGRYTRMSLLLGKTLWGLEVSKFQRLLDHALELPEIDKERVGMWGLSLGGAYTAFTMPIEPRIKVGIIAAWFNSRIRKMIIDDPRYSCFLSTSEEHIFIPGWLREFTDSDLVSLICPRPVMIQAGKCDGIAWWPFLVEEFDLTKEHYVKLGLGERIELNLHEAGHEVRFDSGFEFLKKWLSKEPTYTG